MPKRDRARESRERSARSFAQDDARRQRRAEVGQRRYADGVRQDASLIYGLHTVIAALRNPRRRLGTLYATENAWLKLRETLGETLPAPILVGPGELARLAGADAVHQGVALEVEPLPDLHLQDLPDEGTVLLLDQVTDPHNVGAVLRSAAAFGATGLVMTERHSPQAGGVIAKAASGALEYVPIVTVGNLAQALSALGERGFWRIGLDSQGEATLVQAVNRPPLALVLGAEGKGLRRLTRERCDILARLDMPGAIKSLNVSNAAAVALYALHAAGHSACGG